MAFEKVQTQPGGNIPEVGRKENGALLSLICKLSKHKPMFLSLPWSMASGQTVSSKLHGFFPGEPHAITTYFQPN